MRLFATCPACKAPVTVWRVWAAPTPWQLRCGQCRAKLWIRKWTWPLGIAILLPAIGLAVVLRGAVRAGDLSRPAWLAIMVAYAALADLAASLLICRSGALRLRGASGDRDPPAP